jgi:hypothetical protein
MTCPFLLVRAVRGGRANRCDERSKGDRHQVHVSDRQPDLTGNHYPAGEQTVKEVYESNPVMLVCGCDWLATGVRLR